MDANTLFFGLLIIGSLAIFFTLDSLERQTNNAIEKIELIGQNRCSREYPARLKKMINRIIQL